MKFLKLLLFTLCAVLVAFVLLNQRHDNSVSSTVSSSENKDDDKNKLAQKTLDVDLPVYTKASALICPEELTLDPRVGRELQVAVDAHLSLLNHEESVQKAGCAEWRDGISIHLSEDGKEQIKTWLARSSCGMAKSDVGFVFSCDLRNGNESEILQRGREQFSKALQDPRKARLVECLGVEAWNQKPQDWVPPSQEECQKLQDELQDGSQN